MVYISVNISHELLFNFEDISEHIWIIIADIIVAETSKVLQTTFSPLH